MKFLKGKFSVYCLLFTVCCFGAFFRFYNLNWDQGHFFHPDERNIAAAVSQIHFFGQLDPKFFAYGSFPIYLIRSAGDSIGFLTNNSRWVYDWERINLISRGISALLSSLTIILVFLVGQKIWEKKVGLIASFLTAFTVSLIQTAHYGVTESMLVFWLMIILFLSLKLLEQPTLKEYLRLGLIFGLAVATKVSALSFLIIPILAHFFVSFKERKQFKYLNYQLRLLFSIIISFLTFIFFSPYVFLSWKSFRESMDYESGVATGKLKVVYVLQFEKTFPYLFQLKNLIWQAGPVAILGFIAFLFLIFLAIKKRDKHLLIFLSFPILYFAYIGSWYTKFIRYMVPLIPFIILSTAWFLVEIQKKWHLLGKIILTLALFSSLLWSIAFFSIYTKESTRITASRWIYQNIPKESKILGEHWDDGLPIDLPPNHPNDYKIEQLTIYEPDSQQKIDYYAEKLSGSDYIIINSRRLYGTLIYLPEKYPITSRYYQLLFGDQLGYTKVTEFSSYPEILGVKINDDSAEETFQVYEHPRVMIFKNTKHFSKETLIRNFL